MYNRTKNHHKTNMQTYQEFLDDDDYTRYGPDTHIVRLCVSVWLDRKDTNVEFDMFNMEIHTLPPLPPTMKRLKLGGPHLVYIPSGALPAQLEELVCTYTGSLRRFPPMPNSLVSIIVPHTQITSLPKLPVTIKHIVADSTKIRTLPDLYTGLETLCINDTPIRAFKKNRLPESLLRLEIIGTKITTLPILPPKLHTLIISRTDISILPELPMTIKKLWFSNCKKLLIQPTYYVTWLSTLEDIQNYALQWAEYHEKERQKLRYKKRIDIIKKELITRTTQQPPQSHCGLKTHRPF